MTKISTSYAHSLRKNLARDADRGHNSDQTCQPQTRDQLKKIVTAQTSERWTKIIAFPQNRSSSAKDRIARI